MQDINRTPVAPQFIESKTMVKPSQLGSPGAALADENVNKRILGRIIGIANAVSITQINDQQTGEVKFVKSLRGSFRATPLDPARPIVVSARCGLPEHMMAGAIVALEDPKSPASSVGVAWDLGVERAKNAAGYSWFGRPLLPETVADPLAAFEAQIAAAHIERHEPERLAQTEPPLLGLAVPPNSEAKPHKEKAK